MRSSSLTVFSIFQNVKTFVEKEKDIKIMKMVFKTWYERTNDYNKNHCRRIYSEIENSMYSYEDLAIYLLHLYLSYEKIKLGDLKNINKEIQKFYSFSRLEKDQEFILKLNEKLNFSLEDYFKINSFGGTIIYDELICKDKISPYFCVEYFEYLQEDEKEKSELKRFKRIIKKIKEIKEKKENG